MKNVAKRININLTDREITALEAIKDEMILRGWNGNTSDIIRDAIAAYCTQITGYTFANEWSINTTKVHE